MDSKKPEKSGWEIYKEKIIEARVELQRLFFETFGELLVDRRKLIVISIVVFIGLLAFLRGLLSMLF